MKKFIYTLITALLTTVWSIAGANTYQSEYLGLPGDNLNLYAVMKLFQESETLEGFERGLNDPNSMINNLDLNRDNLIDYISVHDYVDGNVHNIVLRANLNKNVSQDVAVFVVQQFSNGSVHIQLIGDEALYGKNYIIEPIIDGHYAETPNPGYLGTPTVRTNVTVVKTTPYLIAAWPVVRFLYTPSYIAWRSAWYWGYYPTHWNPWRPHYWHYYYGYHSHWNSFYHTHFHYTVTPRYARYKDFYYTNVRTYSPTVIVQINKGSYNDTYSRPEQKAEGEALYARRNPVQTTVARENNAVSSSGRRTTSATTNEKSATTTGTDAQTRNSATLRSGTIERQAETNNAETRRTTSVSATSRRETNSATTGEVKTATQPAPANRAVQTTNTRERNAASSTTNSAATQQRVITQPRTATQQSTTTQRPAAQQRVTTQPKPAAQQRTTTPPAATKSATTPAPRQSTPAVSSGSRTTTQRSSTTGQSRTTTGSTKSTATSGGGAQRSTSSSSSRR